MPYATRTVRHPLPRRARPRAPKRFISVVPDGTGMTLPQQLNGWAFTPQVYLSFDGPAVANPAWTDITSYVDQTQPLTITPGRADGLSDANASTLSLTVDNSDGRWIAGNPSGPWYGQIRKGARIRIDLLPLSGTVSRRFTGYITSLPTKTEGQYSSVTISASDVIVLLTQAPKLGTMLFEDWTSDPVAGQYIVGYFPLHEASGASAAADISGNAPTGAQALNVRSFGVTAGAGLTWAGTPAPGFDGQSAVVFAPTGTLLPGSPSGTTGARPNGSYLQGTIAFGNSNAQISCWINTTVANQPIWSWSDPSTNYSCGIGVDAAGYANVWQDSLSGANPAIGNFGATGLGKIPINDGQWHMLSLRIQGVQNGNAYWSLVVDGTQVWGGATGSNPLTNMVPAANLSRFLLGAAEGWNGDVSATTLAMFTGAISDLVVHLFPSPSINANWSTAYGAGANGHNGDATGLRAARVVGYTGLPTPTTPVSLPGTGLSGYRATTGTSAAMNIGTTAHPCGTQAIIGKNPLDVLRQIARTENMPLFVDAYGRLTLQASTLRENAAAAVTIAAVDLDPSTDFADDFQYTANEVQVSFAGTTLTVDTGGQTSQALYGIYSKSVDSACLNALEAGSLGAAWIALGASPAPRVAPLACEAATLALQPGYGAAWYDAVLALTVSSLVAVTGWFQTSAYGTGGTSTHIIEGWTETITEGTHLFAWSTAPPHPPSYRCDDGTLGVIDTPGIVLAY